MPINSHKPEHWPADTKASVDLYNEWFVRYAPETYRHVRQQATKDVLETFRITRDLRATYGEAVAANPGILPVLRMTTAPPIAVDRLAGLAGVSRGVVATLEAGSLPRMPGDARQRALDAVAAVVTQMIDRDLFPWLNGKAAPSDTDRERAASVVADRLTLSVANPVIRNAQEARQLAVAAEWLKEHGYTEERLPPGRALITMDHGTYAYRMNVVAGLPDEDVNIPVDLVIQPRKPRKSSMPLLIEAKSAGDFANVNKRRKEEADKLRHLRDRYGDGVEYVLLLGGYFDRAYLEYEARAGIDWIWEHRIDDMAKLGL